VFFIVGWQGGRATMQFLPHSIWGAFLFPCPAPYPLKQN
jgi:hypothetical protein